MNWVKQEAVTGFNDQIAHLYEAKAEMAPGLAVAVKEIAETGHDPENTLNDIIKLARMLDIAAPAPAMPRKINNFTVHDPRYNLLDYLKRAAGKMTIRGINGDDVLFDQSKPFTCISQIQEIFQNVSEKINRNFIPQVEHAA